MCLPNNPCLPSIHCHHSWIIIQMCEVQTAKSRSFQPHHVIHCSCSHSLLKFKGTQKAVQFSSDVSDDLQRWFLKVVLKIKEGPEKSGPQKSNRTPKINQDPRFLLLSKHVWSAQGLLQFWRSRGRYHSAVTWSVTSFFRHFVVKRLAGGK